MNVNLLDLIPDRKLNFEESRDGLVILLKPKFKNKFLVKYLLPKMKKPNYKIKLDHFGSFVWKQCDGKNNVEQIATLLKQQFQDDVEPIYERLSLFFQSLAQYKFIEYKNYNSA